MVVPPLGCPLEMCGVVWGCGGVGAAAQLAFNGQGLRDPRHPPRLETVLHSEELSHILHGFFFLIYLFIYLSLAALGLCCCAQAFSSCSERGPLFVAVRRLLIAVASLVAEHRL